MHSGTHPLPLPRFSQYVSSHPLFFPLQSNNLSLHLLGGHSSIRSQQEYARVRAVSTRPLIRIALLCIDLIAFPLPTERPSETDRRRMLSLGMRQATTRKQIRFKTTYYGRDEHGGLAITQSTEIEVGHLDTVSFAQGLVKVVYKVSRVIFLS